MWKGEGREWKKWEIGRRRTERIEERELRRKMGVGQST